MTSIDNNYSSLQYSATFKNNSIFKNAYEKYTTEQKQANEVADDKDSSDVNTIHRDVMNYEDFFNQACAGRMNTLNVKVLPSSKALFEEISKTIHKPYSFKEMASGENGYNGYNNLKLSPKTVIQLTGELKDYKIEILEAGTRLYYKNGNDIPFSDDAVNANKVASGLIHLIHFANGDSEGYNIVGNANIRDSVFYTLNKLGIDLSKEFTINNTKLAVKNNELIRV